MAFALLILLLAFQVAYSDKTYAGITSEKIIDAKCVINIYTTLIVRGYLSSGMVDPNYVDNAESLNKYKANWWPYMNPCFKCGNPEAQFKDLIAATYMPTKSILIYIMAGRGWGSDVAKNRDFLTTLTNKMRESNYLPLIVTSKYDYEKVVGADWEELSHLPMYYESLNFKANCEDFAPFGGWIFAIGKIFGDNYLHCDIKFDVMVGCAASGSPLLPGELQGKIRAN